MKRKLILHFIVGNDTVIIRVCLLLIRREGIILKFDGHLHYKNVENVIQKKKNNNNNNITFNYLTRQKELMGKTATFIFLFSF